MLGGIEKEERSHRFFTHLFLLCTVREEGKGKGFSFFLPKLVRFGFLVFLLAEEERRRDQKLALSFFTSLQPLPSRLKLEEEEDVGKDILYLYEMMLMMRDSEEVYRKVSKRRKGQLKKTREPRSRLDLAILFVQSAFPIVILLVTRCETTPFIAKTVRVPIQRISIGCGGGESSRSSSRRRSGFRRGTSKNRMLVGPDLPDDWSPYPLPLSHF